MTKQADFKARVRARMARTGESYATARAHLLATPAAAGAARDQRRQTVPGIGARGWRSASCRGATSCTRARCPTCPTPSCGDPAPRSWTSSPDRASRSATGTLDEHRHGEYVLWFEADLYDQLQLVQILARLRALDVPPERITLICVGEHLGIAHFGGLGELTSEQLARLPATAATALTPAASSTRRAPGRPCARPTRAASAGSWPRRRAELRFVAEAFDRLSREYPSTRDGLSLTERRLLAAVADGAQTDGDAFVRAAAREARPFLGDTWAFDRLTRLATAPTPLLEATARRHAAAPHRGRPGGARRPAATTSPSTASTAGSAACT